MRRAANFAREARAADGTALDEVLVTRFAAPASYTGEEVVEISGHGGPLVARRLLEAVVAAGARVASPGEFTQRAFLNGKLDLTQAEAVMDLIRAHSDLALRAANEQLSGGLGRRIEALREGLLNLVAHVEAHIDFPDEDITPETGSALLARLDEARAQVAALLDTARPGRILREGLRTAIVGEPNVGKSSLLNALAGRDRAIVSATPARRATRLRSLWRSAAWPCGWSTPPDCENQAMPSSRRASRARIARSRRLISCCRWSTRVCLRRAVRRCRPPPMPASCDSLCSNKIDLGVHSGWKNANGRSASRA